MIEASLHHSRAGTLVIGALSLLVTCVSLAVGSEVTREGRSHWGTLEQAAALSDLIVVGEVSDPTDDAVVYEEDDMLTVYRQWSLRIQTVIIGNESDAESLTLLTRGGAVSDSVTGRYAVDQYQGPQLEGGEKIFACLKRMDDSRYRFALLESRSNTYIKMLVPLRELYFRTRRTDLLGPEARIHPRSKGHESVMVAMDVSELGQFLIDAMVCRESGEVFSSKQPLLVGTGRFISLRHAIRPIQEAAKTYIIERTGTEFFEKRYKQKSSGWRFPEESCRRPEAHCSPLLLQNRAVVRYSLEFPELGIVSADLRLTLNPEGSVIDSSGAIPDCVNNPSSCRIIVDSTEARKLAEDAGLAIGLRPWRLGFRWYERCKTFIWAITNTLSKTHGKTLMIDATSGKVCEESAWMMMLRD